MKHVINYKKDIDFIKETVLTITSPNKIDGVYTSSMWYSTLTDPSRKGSGSVDVSTNADQAEFVLKTPTVIFDGTQLQFSKSEESFLWVLNWINDQIINTIFKDSKDLFGGKVFSMDRISQSVQPLTTELEDKICINIKAENLIVTNVYKQKVENFSTMYPLKGKGLIKISEIVYSGKDILVNVELKQFQLEHTKLKNRKEIISQPLEEFEDDDENKEITENKEIVESFVETTTTKDQVPDDSLDFFQ